MSEHREALRADQPSLGDVLRARRKELRWQLEDVAARLNIRPSVLQALEEDDYHDIPGRAYVVGFIRNYAELMGLDSTGLLLSLFRDFLGEERRVQQQEVFLRPQDERALPVGFLVVVGLMVIGAGYAGWYHFVAHDATAHRHIPTIAELTHGGATEGDAAVGDVPSPRVAAVTPSVAPSPSDPGQTGISPRTDLSSLASQAPLASSSFAPDAAASSPPAFAEAGSTPAQAKAGQASPWPQTEPTDKSQQVAQAPHFAPPRPAPSHADPSDLALPASSSLGAAALSEGAVLHARNPVWVQIFDKSGKMVVQRVLRSGETWRADPSGAPYRMSIGNAGGVTFTAGDVTSAPLGRSGEVLHNVTFDAQAVKSGLFGKTAEPGAEPSPAPSAAASSPAASDAAPAPSPARPAGETLDPELTQQ